MVGRGVGEGYVGWVFGGGLGGWCVGGRGPGECGGHGCWACGCGFVVVRLLGFKVRTAMAGDDEVRGGLVVDEWCVCVCVWVCGCVRVYALRLESDKRVWASRKYLLWKLFLFESEFL